ncbi:conserved hypothetical protein [Magnetococcus marinus MC-1]|uniref:Uncharacterized protein n=1 Tax=Magnetococcus marinus (strain ATCC BAA-1437 / JCM 17883 / MC-1) TaxID=156889 RepID=A0L6V4_MAGMM|nr:CCE_0567 family metalloprotein [Magnetococcus marinus]ABK43697.1 conserved hypothetical protein [Magnetococcus marinus MC-1]
MSDDEKALKKQLAKLKRVASETAGEIHDIVEDTLWSQYDRLPELGTLLAAQCKEALEFEKANGL